MTSQMVGLVSWEDRKGVTMREYFSSLRASEITDFPKKMKGKVGQRSPQLCLVPSPGNLYGDLRQQNPNGGTLERGRTEKSRGRTKQ